MQGKEKVDKMKKCLTLLMAVGLVLALSLPAFAAGPENIFGGYWRTRFTSEQNFSGTDNGKNDRTFVDTRARFFYTAKFPDMKWNLAFEWNTDWGNPDKGGGVGTDGTDIWRFKWANTDFNLGGINFVVGLQGGKLLRGFLFSDDFTGVTATYKGKGFDLPFMWIHAYEGNTNGNGKDVNDKDVDIYAVTPSFKIGDLKVNAALAYAYSKDASDYDMSKDGDAHNFQKLNLYYVGVDVAQQYKSGSGWWALAAYNGGDYDDATGKSVDVGGYVLSFNAAMVMGPMDLHTHNFYLSGDDRSTSDNEGWFRLKGISYGVGVTNYAEILGLGNFGGGVGTSNKPTNIWTVSGGVGYKVTPALKLQADVWHARLAEDDSKGNNEMGTEVDLVADYKLTQNIGLNAVAAYLFAGDALTGGASNDKDPYCLGMRLQIRF